MIFTRVVLADDHAGLRSSIRTILEGAPDITVVGEASDGLQALRLVEALAPDVLLLDMEMPGLEGVEVAQCLKAAGSPVRILALSSYDDKQYILGALANGVLGYLVKGLYRLSGLKEAPLDEAKLNDLAAAQTLVQEVIQTLRATFSELRPPALAPFGLEKAILSHAEQFQRAHPELDVTLELTPDRQVLPELVRLALFRIYQEALNNVVRHAQANTVWVRFILEATQTILEVQDNGYGFKVPPRWVELARQGHLGLVGISERAEAIGGQLQIISTPGEGTIVRVVVPRHNE